MQALKCTFLPATDTLPNRLKVFACSRGIKPKVYTYCQDRCNAHESAERRIAERAIELGWIKSPCQMIFGTIDGGNTVVGVIDYRAQLFPRHWSLETTGEQK